VYFEGHTPFRPEGQPLRSSGRRDSLSRLFATLGLEDNIVTFGSGGLKLGTNMVRRKSRWSLEPEATPLLPLEVPIILSKIE